MSAGSTRTKSVVTSTRLHEKIWENFIAMWVGSPENKVYGNSAILNHFADLANRPISGRLQHGWPAHSPEGLYYQNDYLPSFVWTYEAERAATQKGWKNFRAIGAPWLYLLSILENDGWDVSESNNSDENDKSLWVYGRHALGSDNSEKNRLLDFLALADSKATSVDYCLLYFEDFDMLTANERLQFKYLRIVTLGQRSSSFISDSHLVRIFHLLRSVGTLKIDHPSTLVLYALTLGLQIDWIRNSVWEDAVDKSKKLGLVELNALMYATPGESNQHKAFALRNLGLESIKSKGELRLILGAKNGWDQLVSISIRPIKIIVEFPFKLLRNLFPQK
jgi:hypothetical protein